MEHCLIGGFSEEGIFANRCVPDLQIVVGESITQHDDEELRV